MSQMENMLPPAVFMSSSSKITSGTSLGAGWRLMGALQVKSRKIKGLRGLQLE